MYCRFCGKQLPEDSKFCLNCGKQIGGNPTEFISPTHQSVIREVKISYKLQNGGYPSASQYYKMFSNWKSEWEWSPSNINLKIMKDVLIKAINTYAELGWELIDKIDDELFITEYYRDETPMSKLGSVLRTNWDYTYKQIWTYYGARFHIKSTVSVTEIPENNTININGSDLDPANFAAEGLKAEMSSEEEEVWRVRKFGVEVIMCPKCSTLNSTSFIYCKKCDTKIEKVKPIPNPTLSNNETRINKENFSKLTYRQKFAVTEYGYLLSPEDAEVVGKMLGSMMKDKDILPFCEANGERVISFEE